METITDLFENRHIKCLTLGGTHTFLIEKQCTDSLEIWLCSTTFFSCLRPDASATCLIASKLLVLYIDT